MGRTNLIVFMNEMKIGSKALCGALQQSHDAFFSGGSVGRGFSTPLSALFGSTNEVPDEK